MTILFSVNITKDIEDASYGPALYMSIISIILMMIFEGVLLTEFSNKSKVADTEEKDAENQKDAEDRQVDAEN